MSVTQLSRLVRTGACALDARFPGWWRAEGTATTSPIDCARLDVLDDFDGPLGQMFGDYLDGRTVMNLATWRDAAALGFDLPDGSHTYRPGFAVLTRMWRTVILSRRAHAAELAN